MRGRTARRAAEYYDLRRMVMTALRRAGGIDYLVEQARERPHLFIALLARAMPREVVADLRLDVAGALEQAMRRRQALIGSVEGEVMESGAAVGGEVIEAGPALIVAVDGEAVASSVSGDEG